MCRPSNGETVLRVSFLSEYGDQKEWEYLYCNPASYHVAVIRWIPQAG